MNAKKRTFRDKLRNRYRLVVLDDSSFEERASFRLTRFNVYLLVSAVLVVMVIFIFSLIAFTPLREYIPGYGDLNLQREFIVLQMKTDSLNRLVGQQEKWIMNLRNILQGSVDTARQPAVKKEAVKYDTINLDRVPEEDLKFREEMEREQKYELTFSGRQKKGGITLWQLNFFPPLKGYVTNGFNAADDHYGIDIVAPLDEPIKNILDGSVILSTWTLETGYVIGIQHDHNLVSFYKHNSVLLKKTGNFVKAGDAIAIQGSSGELTSGPHLHFELWHDGAPVNPEDYIIF